MHILLVNGSCHPNGCTYTALRRAADIMEQEGLTTGIFQLGTAPVRDCIACGGCAGKMRCVFDDDCVNELIQKAEQADGFVFGTPVYYAHPSGRLLSALDRAFYAGSRAFTQKPAFAVASARRAGTTASLDAVMKHFTINQMPVISSTYWPMVHGSKPEDVLQDLEGLQTMENAARNMAWILKCIQAGKEQGVLPPDNQKKVATNFIR